MVYYISTQRNFSMFRNLIILRFGLDEVNRPNYSMFMHNIFVAFTFSNYLMYKLSSCQCGFQRILRFFRMKFGNA